MTGVSDTVAILASPDRPAAAASAPGLKGALAKLQNAARYRRNPRSPEYMRALALSMMPGATVIEVDRQVPASPIAASRHIVLLWPDAIGFGWTGIERAVFRAKRTGARVSAITGRRRHVELRFSTLLAFRLRRVVERMWLGEIAAASSLLLSAPVLVAWDFARGRR